MRTNGPRADREVDRLYADLRDRYGSANPRANGYQYRGYFENERRILLSLMDPDAPITVDIACGSGLMLAPWRTEARFIVGVDFNADACAAARGNGVTVVRADATGLPFADASVDQLISCQFFNQQQSAVVARCVAEMSRVLRPRGQAVLVWRNADALVHRLAEIVLTTLDHWRGLPLFPQQTHSLASLGSNAATSGLVVEREEVSFPPLCWRTRAVRGLAARIIGASNICVLRKPSEPSA